MDGITVRFDRDNLDQLKQIAYDESKKTHVAIGVSGLIRRTIVEIYGLNDNKPITMIGGA